MVLPNITGVYHIVFCACLATHLETKKVFHHTSTYYKDNSSVREFGYQAIKPSGNNTVQDEGIWQSLYLPYEIFQYHFLLTIQKPKCQYILLEMSANTTRQKSHWKKTVESLVVNLRRNCFKRKNTLKQKIQAWLSIIIADITKMLNQTFNLQILSDLLFTKHAIPLNIYSQSNLQGISILKKTVPNKAGGFL